MSFGDSKAIVSNQDGIHENLAEVVHKHLSHDFKKPVSEHTAIAFDKVNALVQQHQGPVILDSCCGVGKSTELLAKKFPDALVIGVDKSAHRLARYPGEEALGNCHLLRADLNDFYRLAKEANWQLARHYVLYPNPWPKSKHLQRRWHGSPVFPYMLALGGAMEVRSNWRIYLEEFQAALALAGFDSTIEPVVPGEPLTLFEAKYQASEQQCWSLCAQLTS